VNLGGAAQEGFRVVHDGVTIETMDRAQAYREAHMGAVLFHQGEKYLVKELDLERHLVRVEPVDVDYYTRPLQTAEIEIISVLQEKWCGPVRLSFGDVLVTETYSAYKLIRGETVIGIEPLHLPPLTFCTKALWFVTPEEDCTLVDASGRDLAGGLHGVEHAMIATIPFHVMCDRWDLGGISTPYSPQTGGATIFVYDGYEGGIGLSEKAYALFGPVTATTFELVSECGCKEGCPACIYSPKCGNDNQPLDKAAAILLLGRLARSGGLSDETPATVRKTG
jgi:DEAD/DEAH box helicase domain-containing protein